MARFPTLVTGAATQFGFERKEMRPVAVQRFLDGSSRRFPVSKVARFWKLSFRSLNALEAEQIESFVSTHLESQTTFTFMDPWTCLEYEGCEIVENSVHCRAEGDHKYALTLEIQQRPQ